MLLFESFQSNTGVCWLGKFHVIYHELFITCRNQEQSDPVYRIWVVAMNECDNFNKQGKGLCANVSYSHCFRRKEEMFARRFTMNTVLIMLP